jgi:hypothetical protein
MKNEYLILSVESRPTVEAYRPDGITIEIFGIANTPLWIATYSLEGKNENSAEKLSDVHSFIIQYAPLVLSCESSEYYNKTLFPLVNELERKLRKLLYLAASISDNEKAKENINQLEEKDFGEIFDLLFIDQDFIRDVKKRINADSKSEFNGQSKYSKAEIKTYLDSLTELTLWDAVLGEEYVPTLRSRFREVQTYRNDVMHAHNIVKKLYGKSRYLFNEINKELDSAISSLIKNTKDEKGITKPDINTAISSAIAAMSLSTISDLLDSAKGIQLPSTLPALTEIIDAFQPLNENIALTEALRNVRAFLYSPAMESVLRQMRQIYDLIKPSMQM